MSPSHGDLSPHTSSHEATPSRGDFVLHASSHEATLSRGDFVSHASSHEATPSRGDFVSHSSSHEVWKVVNECSVLETVRSVELLLQRPGRVPGTGVRVFQISELSAL